MKIHLAPSRATGALLPLLILAIVVSCLGGTEDAIGIDEMVRRVEGACLAGRPFSVTAHQTLFTNVAHGRISADSRAVEQADYPVEFGVSGTLRVVRQISSPTPSGNSRDATSQNGSTRRWSFTTVNPVLVARHLQGAPSHSITEEVLEGWACYKIAAPMEQFQLTAWIARSDWTVRRAILTRASVTLYDARIDYTNWDNRMVPRQVVISVPAQGTMIVQNYSGHGF